MSIESTCTPSCLVTASHSEDRAAARNGRPPERLWMKNSALPAWKAGGCILISSRSPHILAQTQRRDGMSEQNLIGTARELIDALNTGEGQRCKKHVAVDVVADEVGTPRK